MPRTRFDEFSYDGIAWLYDELAALYSFGRIARSKAVHLGVVAPGDRVLFAGAGRGSDALIVARRGARVTAIDLSPRMLGRFERRLAREGLAAERIVGDVADHAPAAPYDVGVAHYFLNLYDEVRAGAMLAHLGRLVRPGGTLLLADFARPRPTLFGRFLADAYYRPVDWLAWALGYCALHPILDYGRLLAPLPFRIGSEVRLPLLPGGDPAYVAIRAERCA
jgi:ubiquinone/menaquinone biosynthesis C-methylase UbiE